MYIMMLSVNVVVDVAVNVSKSSVEMEKCRVVCCGKYVNIELCLPSLFS